MIKKRAYKEIVFVVLTVIIISIALTVSISSYLEKQPKLQYTFNTTKKTNTITYPDTRFAVISDLHFYDNTLGTTGSAFEACLTSDRKLLKDSSALLELSIDKIIQSGVEFVLIPGDLTKDGELVCHQKLTSYLAKLKEANIKAFVIPGNHDINNPGANKYDGDKAIGIDSINAEDFSNLYKDYGYGNSIYRNMNSLSYVAEPVKGLWLIALDTCRYEENEVGKEEIVGGKMTQDQVDWLQVMLQKAKEKGNSVIVMEHHGLVEHWNGQSKLHPDYLVQDFNFINKLMASYNVRIAFTGHYHAQDIALADYKDAGYIYDIETGSLITAPCPIRYCSIKENKLQIKSDSLVDKLHPETNFAKESDEFVKKTIKIEALNTLRKYRVSPKDSDYISNAVAAAFSEHYKGDESIARKPAFETSKLDLWERFIYSQQKYVLEGLWKDKLPADVNIELDLKKLN